MNLLEKVNEKVPNLPGCYLYYDQNETVIYVGKAKNLKKRMQSYFNRENNIKTQHLVSKIKKFDYFITNNEKEALILENNLIKKYTPFYNIVLKDDKKYPYFIITKEKNPKFIRSRNRKIKGTYFGPYPSGAFVTEIINYLNKKIPLRKCQKLPKEKCVYAYIGQCYAPCVNNDVSKEEIDSYVKLAKDYLQNDMRKLYKEVEKEMYEYSAKMQFEEANKSKNFLEMIINAKADQSVQLKEKISLHIYDYYIDKNFIAIVILEIENGKLININRSLLPYYDDEVEEITSYLYNFYQVNKQPQFFATENKDLIQAIKSIILINSKNLYSKEYKKLVEIAKSNAREYYQKNIERITKEYFTKKHDGYNELQRLTNAELNRIEMYDISHLGGDAQVGAMIVYTKGKKDKKEYRKYKIKKAENIKDDYGSTREVLDRRLVRGIEEGVLPDLIIADGGKGQVTSILEILNKYNLQDTIKLIGLSKDNKHTTTGIVNKNLEEKKLNRNSELYKFFYELQEEVHRYAIDFHRQVKVKSLFQSELDQIPGVGPKRKKKLIEHFEYVENIKKASKEELQELNLSDNIINNIMEYFKEEERK